MEIGRLVEGAKMGDVAAFTTLVQRYQAMAFGYAYATTRDFDLAEDAAQQAFITAWRNLDNLTHPERFGGWLRGIVRFECLHLLRARPTSQLAIDTVNGVATSDPGPAELAEGNEAVDGILAAINALPEAERIADDASGLKLTAQVAQYLDDDLIRCFMLDEPTRHGTHLNPGTAIRDLGEPVTTPLGMTALHGIIERIRRKPSRTAIQDTGIKAIDLFSPLPASGMVALVGDMQTGKIVLVEELIHRLGDLSHPISILVFVETTTEVSAIQQLDYRTSGSVEAIYLPVADASPEALAPVLGSFDAVITLSRTLGKERLYPAIDPLRSTSRLLDPAVVGDDHDQVVREARTVLGTGDDPALAARLRNYLSQPFYVAEAFTNRPGVTVLRDVSVADVRSLLDGAHADLTDEELYMVGSIGVGASDE